MAVTPAAQAVVSASAEPLVATTWTDPPSTRSTVPAHVGANSGCIRTPIRGCGP